MKYEVEVMDYARKLGIFRSKDIGELLAARGFYREENNSAWNNATKILKYITGGGELEEGDGFFRIVGSTKSNFCEHSKLLTKALVQILKVFPGSLVIREKEIPTVKIVPDALVVLCKGDRGIMCILEAVNNETPEYLQSKVDVWNTWPESLNYLSSVFGNRIPHFEIVAYPESPIKDVWNFQDFMNEAEER